jgi:hypothetical protein
MKSTAGMPNAASPKELEYKEQFQAQVNQYLEKQHPVVRGLHRVLQGLSLLCLALSIICFCVALYHTFLWATTGSFTSLGKATYLPNAWVNFGLSMSLLVFPWGLDSMLLRVFPVFPAVIFPGAWYRSSKPLPFNTGPGAFFAGFGVTCAGAPGAAYFIGLASQALQRIF